MAQTNYECSACGHEAQDYTRLELEQRGWVWHTLTKTAFGTDDTSFILCTGCDEAATRRRRARAEREAPRLRCSHCNAETMVLPAPESVIGTPFARALPISLCRECDRYPELLHPRTGYEARLLYPPRPGELT